MDLDSTRARSLITYGLSLRLRKTPPAPSQRAPFRSARRIIDLSGDGDNNAGRGVTNTRDESMTRGITINGLVILSDDDRDHTNPSGGLEDYYRRNVIGGPGAFVMVSDGFNSFRDVLTRKLVTEIAAHPSARRRDFAAR